MELYYIIYSSRPVRILNDEEIEDLLSAARRENEAYGVTGMLLCFNDMYIQLIEGTKAAITQLYSNIKNDMRHTRIFTLQEGNIENRFFQDWSMGFDKDDRTLDESKSSFDLSDPQSSKLLEILGWELN